MQKKKTEKLNGMKQSTYYSSPILFETFKVWLVFNEVRERNDLTLCSAQYLQRC
jgi:hypothetical protein